MCYYSVHTPCMGARSVQFADFFAVVVDHLSTKPLPAWQRQKGNCLASFLEP